jgi:response regulator RpfG family c-di-GMP phosphodiesterase
MATFKSQTANRRVAGRARMRAVNPSPGNATAAAARRRCLLVVEDEALIALNMVEQFAELGYAVIGPAFTIAEAKHLATVASIDAAVVDLNLHGVYAEEVADIIALRKIPFLFVTGYSHLPDRRFRHISILTKPFQVVDLHRAVEDLLAGTARKVAAAARSEKTAQASK